MMMTTDRNIFEILRYPTEPTHPQDIDINDYKTNYVDDVTGRLDCSLQEYVEEHLCNWERFCIYYSLNFLDKNGKW
jgi:hypothetical protein